MSKTKCGYHMKRESLPLSLCSSLWMTVVVSPSIVLSLNQMMMMMINAWDEGEEGTLYQRYEEMNENSPGGVEVILKRENESGREKCRFKTNVLIDYLLVDVLSDQNSF
ncbi:hypothetical protein CAEBREN_31597 [Caenorhabditis brenneri]|uniref:Uncharacterized protein n=1 Tax=Caenorhabditis brenneri TaxID=135651 RepID=G0NMP1_CAEBE|nr:hypothetical protein CAEBREN_31597 [Caenorhabditis brenneri]